MGHKLSYQSINNSIQFIDWSKWRLKVKLKVKAEEGGVWPSSRNKEVENVSLEGNQMERAWGTQESYTVNGLFPVMTASPAFDVSKNTASDPPFSESEVDSYFSMFQLKYDKNGLSGNAQDVVASLSF